MSVAELIRLSNIFLIIGVILIVLSVIMVIKFDIYRAWHFATGHKLKEGHEKKIRENIIENISRKITTQKIHKIQEMTDVLPATDGNMMTSEAVTVELKGEQGTQPLMIQQPSETTDLRGFRLKYDVTFIHTTIRI